MTDAAEPATTAPPGADGGADRPVDLLALPGVELLRHVTSLPDPPASIGRLLGMRVEEIEVGRVSFSVDTRRDFSNPLGTTHGGICATLLDSAMGCAVHASLGPGESYGTLELKVNYLRPIPTDGVTLTAVGTTVHVGTRTATAEGRVTDDRGRLVAHGSTTCILHR